MKKDSIKYKKDANTRIKSIVLSSVFGVISLYILLNAEKHTLYSLFPAFFLIISIWGLYDSIFRSNSIIINRSGINIRTNGMGIVEWKFIDDFSKGKLSRGNCLIVELNNIDLFLNTKSYPIRNLMNTNTKKFGSPIVIPEAEFGKSIEEVINEIKEYQKLI
ncbi:hypothetical protein SAMN04488007_1429 [Maribacter aquivivus]|uniref:Uncharacterized protein n=1 Tax=Maribacter aquivivus TaxID=228958 RepID=A0A1M6M5A4_9FLAO|nr:STM3941 family protein [Maribacter aquivivus]SHJ78645.1 hypothetical protein SAMN04488007_1429 [Maribacter aquivivus]